MGARGFRPMTRRQACALAAGFAGGVVLGLPGCAAEDEDPHSQTGFATDTEVKDYPLTLTLYVDQYLYWEPCLFPEFETALDRYAARYQSQTNRADVSFDFRYADWTTLQEYASSGFPDGDGLICWSVTVNAGNDAGTVDGGAGGYLVRDMSYHFGQTCTIVRAAGSTAELPAAATLTGEDAPDGSINRVQQLPNFDGLVAIADPDVALEGFVANQVLAREGFYTNEGGGYSESVASKLRIYPDQDSAMAAVAEGRCQLGFAFGDGLSDRFGGVVEKVYEPSGGNMAVYSGAALANAAEPGVARDFFEFINRCSD